VLGARRAGKARGRAIQALTEVGLETHSDAWPMTLSGGEAQRVALARALATEPALLLLDEPFAALDALTRIRMHDLVARLYARHQPAVVLVTHDVDEAILLADRVLVLSDGHIGLNIPVEIDKPRLRDDPRFLELRGRLLAQLGVAHTVGGTDPDPVTPPM
jgi:sulfonate transport system ATP-binding protein